MILFAICSLLTSNIFRAITDTFYKQHLVTSDISVMKIWETGIFALNMNPPQICCVNSGFSKYHKSYEWLTLWVWILLIYIVIEYYSKYNTVLSKMFLERKLMNVMWLCLQTFSFPNSVLMMAKKIQIPNI